MAKIIRQTQQSQNQNQEAEVWLNIGYFAEEDGEFISLPYGIALDTMKDANTRSNDPHWRAIAHAKNELLAQLLALADKLQEGESKTLNNNIVIQMYSKKASDDTVDTTYEMPTLGFSFV